MNIIFFEDEVRKDLLPLTFTRPVSAIRIGILTIREKWEMYFKGNYSDYTESYLAVKYPLHWKENSILINGSVCPDEELVAAISSLSEGELLLKDGIKLAAKPKDQKFNFDQLKSKEYNGSVFRIDSLAAIFSKNEEAIQHDFSLLTQGRKSQPLSSTNRIIGNPEWIFLEENAKVECAVLNTTAGPIYIGKDAEIMEGSMVRGPFSLGEHAQLKMASKIYGATTIGPYSKIGGEVNNAVIMGYSNKAHDGFLGNSVIGEWCNLGADTNNSNLKNNYAEVKLWNYSTNNFKKTGLQFCGLIMGDHSKCGINTMFNTGTVVGVSCNLFGSGFPRNFVPDFSWGGAQGFEVFALNKAIEVAEKVYERRGKTFDKSEQAILQHIFEITEAYRKY